MIEAVGLGTFGKVWSVKAMSSTSCHGFQQYFTICAEGSVGKLALVILLGRKIEFWEADATFIVARECLERACLCQSDMAFFFLVSLTMNSLLQVSVTHRDHSVPVRRPCWRPRTKQPPSTEEVRYEEGICQCPVTPV